MSTSTLFCDCGDSQNESLRFKKHFKATFWHHCNLTDVQWGMGRLQNKIQGCVSQQVPFIASGTFFCICNTEQWYFHKHFTCCSKGILCDHNHEHQVEYGSLYNGHTLFLQTSDVLASLNLFLLFHVTLRNIWPNVDYSWWSAAAKLSATRQHCNCHEVNAEIFHKVLSSFGSPWALCKCTGPIWLRRPSS